MTNSKISALTSATTPVAGTEVLPIVQSNTTKQVSIANLTAGRTISAANYEMTSISFAATIGTNTYFGQTASTAHIAGNVGSIGFGVNDGGNPAGVFVTNTFNGTYSSQEVELRTAQGGVSVSTTRLRATKAGDVEFNTGNLIQGTAAKGVNFTANTGAAGMTSQLLNWYEEGTWTPNQGAGLTLVGAFSSAGTYTRVGRQVFIQGSVSGATSVAAASAGAISTNLPYSAAANATGGAINAANNVASILRVSSATLTAATAIAATATITFSATYSV